MRGVVVTCPRALLLRPYELLRRRIGLDWRSRGAGCWRSRLDSLQCEFDAGEVARVGLRRHLDFIVVRDRAVVMDGYAIEGDIEGEGIAVDFAVAEGDGIALGALHRAGERDAVLLDRKSVV